MCTLLLFASSCFILFCVRSTWVHSRSQSYRDARAQPPKSSQNSGGRATAAESNYRERERAEQAPSESLYSTVVHIILYAWHAVICIYSARASPCHTQHKKDFYMRWQTEWTLEARARTTSQCLTFERSAHARESSRSGWHAICCYERAYGADNRSTFLADSARVLLLLLLQPDWVSICCLFTKRKRFRIFCYLRVWKVQFMCRRTL